jgi:hypothetical protein
MQFWEVPFRVGWRRAEVDREGVESGYGAWRWRRPFAMGCRIWDTRM